MLAREVGIIVLNGVATRRLGRKNRGFREKEGEILQGNGGEYHYLPPPEEALKKKEIFCFLPILPS